MSFFYLNRNETGNFKFTIHNIRWVLTQIEKYPDGRQASAVISILWRAQEQEGWLSKSAIKYTANILRMTYLCVLEIATFYSMFQLTPVGKILHIQICGTTCCMFRGGYRLINYCKKHIARIPHQISKKKCSLEEV